MHFLYFPAFPEGSRRQAPQALATERFNRLDKLYHFVKKLKKGSAAPEAARTPLKPLAKRLYAFCA